MSSGQSNDCNEQSNGQAYRHSTKDQSDSSGVEGERGVSNDQRTLDTLLSEISEDLQPLTPSEGVDRYIRHRTDITDLTKSEYRRKLEFFLEFADRAGIDNLNSLSGREIAEYRTWRREDSTASVQTLSSKTMRDDMFLFRDFVAYLESIEAVSEGLSDKVRVPEVDDSGRDIELAPDRLNRILEYLNKFEYATLDHTLFCLLKEAGRRIGGIQALDLDDYHHDHSDPYLEFHHRPGETRLKNGDKSEAQVSLSSTVAEVLDDYIETHRYDVDDDYGRQPLLTTTQGRPAISTLRRRVYKWTRPCQVGESCPHGKSPETCEAAIDSDSASKCESSRPPHALRHGYLTELRREGVPIEVIQDRCDVSEAVLEKHYDERSEDEKRQQRSEILEGIRDNGGGYL